MDKELIKKYLPAVVFIILVIIVAFSRTGKDDNKDDKLTLVTEANSKQVNNLKETNELLTKEKESETESETYVEEVVKYKFRNDYLLSQHYDKHGVEMGFDSKEDYERAASLVINNKNALHKTEQEDGDDVYYLESTNEFVVLSTDGYIRTYFNPNGGIDYFNRQ